MTTGQAKASFEITGWQEEVLSDEAGAKVVHARVTKRFTGEVVGTSIADLLLANVLRGTAAYVGYERLTCMVSGLAGTFLLQHVATSTAESGGRGTWSVVPDSGTGELSGLQGSAELIRHEDGTHTFLLDYSTDSTR